MRTVILGSQPPEVEALIARRARHGQDTHDEVWHGELHMNPAPRRSHADVQAELMMLIGPIAKQRALWPTVEINLGTADNYRVPDAALFRSRDDDVFNATAALVVEVVSPDDESYAKFDHYAAHDVDEVWIIEPDERTVRMWHLIDGAYIETDRSSVLDLTVETVTADFDWP